MDEINNTHINTGDMRTTLCGEKVECRYYYEPRNLDIWEKNRRSGKGFFWNHRSTPPCPRCLKELDHLLAIHALEQATL